MPKANFRISKFTCKIAEKRLSAVVNAFLYNLTKSMNDLSIFQTINSDLAYKIVY